MSTFCGQNLSKPPPKNVWSRERVINALTCPALVSIWVVLNIRLIQYILFHIPSGFLPQSSTNRDRTMKQVFWAMGSGKSTAPWMMVNRTFSMFSAPEVSQSKGNEHMKLTFFQKSIFFLLGLPWFVYIFAISWYTFQIKYHITLYTL